jgi:hypothetical protein
MRLDYAASTCSMAEVVDLGTWQSTLTDELARLVKEANEANRKILITNVGQSQRNKQLLAALKKNKFKRVGRYPGNSDSFVHVYIRGLK